MPLDLGPIRARLATTIGDWPEFMASDKTSIPKDSVFVSQVLSDVGALLEEVDGLEEDLKTTASNLEYTAEQLAQSEAEVKRLETIILNARRQLRTA